HNGSSPNAPGWELRVVPNKFPALKVEGGLEREGEGMFDRMNGVGAHEVIIETPDHGKTLSTMSEAEIERVLYAFRDRIQDLKKDRRFRYILVFKNHGAAAGATVEHTHSRHIARFEDAPRQEYEGLARVLKSVLTRMDRALERPAYNLIIHSAPFTDETMEFYHWHMELMPKLTKVAGFEWGTGFYINPTSPEEAARYLREAVVETAELAGTR